VIVSVDARVTDTVEPAGHGASEHALVLMEVTPSWHDNTIVPSRPVIASEHWREATFPLCIVLARVTVALSEL
jgi:hypothetical protein